GLRLPPGSPGCELVLTWLRAGAPGPAASERRLVAIALAPVETTLATQAHTQLRVIARYSDGAVRDVSRWPRYVSNQDNVAKVADDGQGSVVGTGDAIIRAHYGGQVAISRLLVPIRSSAAGNSSPQPFPRPLTLVDPPIFAKLR